MHSDAPDSRDLAQVQTLREVERNHILHVLGLTRGNRTRAAQLLGVDRKTLYRKLRDYGIAPRRTPSP